MEAKLMSLQTSRLLNSAHPRLTCLFSPQTRFISYQPSESQLIAASSILLIKSLRSFSTPFFLSSPVFCRSGKPVASAYLQTCVYPTTCHHLLCQSQPPSSLTRITAVAAAQVILFSVVPVTALLCSKPPFHSPPNLNSDKFITVYALSLLIKYLCGQ